VPQFASVMWANIDDGSSAKRLLSTDDTRGVCAIYPPAQDPHSCTQNLPDDGCGCATAAGAPTNRFAAAALAVLALVTRRRRQERD
jgi:MYXO-CTERM domain-containing protein